MPRVRRLADGNATSGLLALGTFGEAVEKELGTGLAKEVERAIASGDQVKGTNLKGENLRI